MIEHIQTSLDCRHACCWLFCLGLCIPGLESPLILVARVSGQQSMSGFYSGTTKQNHKGV